MKAYRYRLPLSRTIKLGSQTISVREGILLSKEGRWAEAAPLPAFSPETLAQVIEALRGNRPAPPSLRFALSSLDQEPFATTQHVNALVQGTPEAVLETCARLANEACLAIKLKVARQHWQDEANLVLQIRNLIRPDQALRLDANRGWDWQTALKFADATQGVNIQYIEEPLQDPYQLEAFANETGITYALDETLLEAFALSEFPSAAAYIVKPTLLGDESAIEKLSQVGKPLIFSACYESGVGTIELARLANRFCSTEAAGFDTYSYLQADVLVSRLRRKDWRLMVPAATTVDMKLLSEIPL